MQKHVRNYLRAHNLGAFDFVDCKVCGSQAVDIHHIEPRSKFGSKRKEEQDAPSNLIALCRSCHDKAHNYILSKDYLRSLI